MATHTMSIKFLLLMTIGLAFSQLVVAQGGEFGQDTRSGNSSVAVTFPIPLEGVTIAPVITPTPNTSFPVTDSFSPTNSPIISTNSPIISDTFTTGNLPTVTGSASRENGPTITVVIPGSSPTLTDKPRSEDPPTITTVTLPGGEPRIITITPAPRNDPSMTANPSALGSGGNQSDPASGPVASAGPKRPTLSAGVIAAIAVGVTSVVLCIIGLVAYYWVKLHDDRSKSSSILPTSEDPQDRRKKPKRPRKSEIEKHHHHVWLNEQPCLDERCELNAKDHRCAPHAKDSCPCTCRDDSCPETKRRRAEQRRKDAVNNGIKIARAF